MATVIQARDLRGERTERLIDAVPLPAPWTLFLEPTNSCNFRCQYCPTGHTDLLQKIGRKNTLMKWELFEKIVDDLKKFPRKLKRINLYKDGESTLHPHFCDMVSQLKNANVTESIWLKTNGSTLKPSFNKKLVDCGLDMLGISVQGSTAQAFYDIAGVKIDYEKYRANVLDLFERSRGKLPISIKVADYGQGKGEIQKFLDDFSDRCDYITVEGLHGWSSSDTYDWKLGTNNSFDGSPRTEKIACPLVLYMLTINSNGDISICNDDFRHAHQIGNANDMGLVEIWNGQRLKGFRLMHLEGRRSENVACATCDYLQALPDRIDDEREIYAERLRNG